MKLILLPNDSVVNLDHLTHARRNKSGDVALHFPSAGGEYASIVLVKKGAGDIWAYLAGEAEEDFSDAQA